MLKQIAMISYHTCPLAAEEGKETGGMNVYVLELSKELAKQGWKVDIFTRAQGLNCSKIVNFRPNLRVIHLSAGVRGYISKKELPRYIDEFTQKVINFIHKEKISYRVLHAHYFMSGLIGANLIKEAFPNLPLIMHFHTLALMKNLVARDEGERESEYRVKSEFKLVKIADKIIASSLNDKTFISTLYNCPDEKIRVIAPGVDIKLFHPIAREKALKFIKEPETSKIILFVGRVEPLKGVDVLMYALKICLKKRPTVNFRLLIVGGNNRSRYFNCKELKRLKSLQETLGLGSIVKFVSQQKQKELPFYYNAADLVVMPSYYETFGMTALEAMACGAPVITTDTSGASEIIGKQRNLIIPVSNPLTLASEIIFSLKQKKNLQTQKQMLSKVRYLSWKKVAQETAKLYREL
ncbi:MAG: glycosyltransferase [Candidatus Beckwithbacteria bacterium]|nr:glycosyltransferase [Candidatus Beckwithbacteria bacterium]